MSKPSKATAGQTAKSSKKSGTKTASAKASSKPLGEKVLAIAADGDSGDTGPQNQP